MNLTKQKDTYYNQFTRFGYTAQFHCIYKFNRDILNTQFHISLGIPNQCNTHLNKLTDSDLHKLLKSSKTIANILNQQKLSSQMSIKNLLHNLYTELKHSQTNIFPKDKSHNQSRSSFHHQCNFKITHQQKFELFHKRNFQMLFSQVGNRWRGK